MAKCGACGKFLSTNDCVQCGKCSATFHRACVAIPQGVAVKSSWLCPGCKVNTPRTDNTATPIKGIAADYNPEQRSSPGGEQLDDTAHNVTEEFKIDLALEIRSFRTELSAMRAEIRECRVEIGDFKESLKVCLERIGSVEDRVAALERKFEGKVPTGTDPLEDVIADLKVQLNDRDQELLSNDLEIAGVPEERGECLQHIVKLISIKLGVELEERDLVDVERIGSTRRNRVEGGSDGTEHAARGRVIAVRVARRTKRDQLMHAARVRRVLTTTELELPGATQRVYLNERLTRVNRQMFYRAREAGRRISWKYVWTRNGKILARKEDGKPVERIRTEKDIDKIFGTC